MGKEDANKPMSIVNDNMNYTPETDDQPIIYAINDNGYQVPCVDIEYARKLERERDDLQKAVNGLCKHIGVSPANTTLLAVEVLRIERKLDEALEKIKQQKLEIVRLNGATNHAGGTPLKIALRERDEAITRRMETIMQCELYERERDEARERERVAITSWDEERQRALREGKRVLEERENFKSIVDKVNELIARWDQPSWKDTAPTARYINALRIAVRAYERQKP